MNKRQIETIRNKLGLSQRQFAEKLGVSQKTVWSWESGRSEPSGEHLERLTTLQGKQVVKGSQNLEAGSQGSQNLEERGSQGSQNLEERGSQGSQNLEAGSQGSQKGSQENVSSPDDTNDTTQNDTNDTKSENVSKKQDTKLTGIDGMRSSFAQHVLDEIDIVQLVSEDTTIEGDKAQCPFPDHDDTDPSFRVYPETQSFNCFGCKKGGSAIDYIIHRDNVEPAEAIRILCNWANIPMPEWTPEQRAKWGRQKTEKDVVTNILRDAFQIYHDEMDEAHWDHFRGRGLTSETIKRDLFGYAPNDETFLFSRLKGKYSAKELLSSGLFVNLGGNIKDAYQRRYLFPYWHQSKIVYSIGRLDTNDPEEIAQLPSWNRGKYKKHLTHTEKHPYVSETIENVIYNADSVRAFDEGIITEGIIDARLAKQAGFGVISPVTTKFAKHDIEGLCKLAKHWNTVYIINDNEVSGEGEKGAIQTAERLFSDGQDARLVTLPRPEGVGKIDLADYLNVPTDQRDGVTRLAEGDACVLHRVDELKQLVNEAPDYIEWKINEVADLSERDRPKPTREIFTLLANIDDKLALERYSDAMQQAELVSKQSFKDTLKDASIEKAKQRKQEQMEFLESESPELFLKAQIEEIRKNKYSKIFKIKQDISSIVTTNMLEQGRFYKTRTEHYYYFNNDTRQLAEIGDRTFEHYTNDRYNLNRSEKEYEYLVAELETEAGLRGELTDVYRFAYYDVNRHTLYVDRNDNQFYRLNGDIIERLSNGTDGVLFISDISHEPLKMVDIGEQKFINRLIIEPTNFMQGEHVNLNKQEQEVLLNVWIHTLFFEELQPTKPILTFIGEKGSGKTTKQKSIGKWLIGNDFNVQGINEEDDFLATITNNYLASFDNVDTYKKWLNDRLSQVATGQRIEKRELYTTNRIARYYPRCFITLNSREPKFRRDDVVDRLLLFRVERLKHFKSEARILKEIADHRDQLWSELLHDLNEIVSALREDTEPFTSSYRMADFAELGWRIAKIDDAGDPWLELLDKMQKERSEFLLFDDPIYQAIHAVLSSGHKLHDMTSGQLYSVFKEYAEKDDIAFSYVKDARVLGQKLGHLLNELQEYFDITREKHYTGWHYTITKKVHDDADK